VQLKLLGVDISTKAIGLARYNLKRIGTGNEYRDTGRIEFVRADVLAYPDRDQISDPPSLEVALQRQEQPLQWDILISNPPYISPSAYWKTTTRSVRGFEPKLALVPPAANDDIPNSVSAGDEFYPRLLAHANNLGAKIVLLEVADLEQALRVARMARKMNVFGGIEIWRDQPDQTSDLDEPSKVARDEFPIIGAGHGRSVLCWRDVGAVWLGKRNKSFSSP
jgi:methylase of polypeptide subunit release factors